MATQHIAELDGDALEIRITIDSAQAQRKRFGFQLFADENHVGLPVIIHPESGVLRVGAIEAPFAVSDLAPDEDVELRIFIDKYLVEVFANDRQAAVAAYRDYTRASGLNTYTYGGPTTIKKVEIWRLKSTDQGFLDARRSRIWEPAIA